MAEAILVGVRVRPFNDMEKANNARLCVEMRGPTTIVRDDRGVENAYTFDESFWSHDGFEEDYQGYCTPLPGSMYADQKSVFEKFGKRVMDNAWNGFHCCLFAYGQTGAGKSYSMVGEGANKGIVPISCEEIFRRIAENDSPNRSYEVVVSEVEIYNDTVQDLLIDPHDRPRKGLEIRESTMMGIYIEGVTKRPVDCYSAIEEVTKKAAEHRTLGSTLMNTKSSRAHTVVSIEFKQVQKCGDVRSVKVSTINLVDLAGSEKAGQTKARGDRLKEGAMINKSLSALGLVIERLAQKSSGKASVLVPYRDSKLTRLLQNALGGSSKTIMICAISPANTNYEESLSTLRYADRAKKIKLRAEVNENPQDKLVRELREENAKLKEMMEKLQSGTFVDSSQLQEQMNEVQAAEKALLEMQRSFNERLLEAQGRHSETSSQASSRPKQPHITNLNEDVQLTGRLKYEFPEGTTMIGQVGGIVPGIEMRCVEDDDERMDSQDDVDEEEDDLEEPDVRLVGEGIYARHANVTNIEGLCVLRALGPSMEATLVNGKSLKELAEEKKRGSSAVFESFTALQAASLNGKLQDQGGGETLTEGPEPREALDMYCRRRTTDGAHQGVVLKHGDRIVFGKSLWFFVDPSEGNAEVLSSSKQVTYQQAQQELNMALWRHSGHAFVRGMKSGRTRYRLERHLNNLVTGDFEDDDEESDDEPSSAAALREQLKAKDEEIAALRKALAEATSSAGGGAGAADKVPTNPSPKGFLALRAAQEAAEKLRQGLTGPLAELGVARAAMRSAAFELEIVAAVGHKAKELEMALQEPRRVSVRRAPGEEPDEAPAVRPLVARSHSSEGLTGHHAQVTFETRGQQKTFQF